MAVNIDAMAAQSAQQGQQLYNQFKNQAATSTNQYNNYQQAANNANNDVKNYTTAMQGNYDASKGTGNAQSAYDYNLGQQEGNVGYDQGAMTNASNAVNQDLGQIAGARDFMNQAASKWGMNAGAFSAFNANSLGSLNDTLAAHQGAVSQLMDKYKTAQTGANSVVGFQQKGQEDTLTGLQQVYSNAADQRDKAGEMMNFYNNMAAQQGGLNSKQQSDYAAAKQAYAQAQAAMSQASLFASQSAQIQQQIRLMDAAATPQAQLKAQEQTRIAAAHGPTAAQVAANDADAARANQNVKATSSPLHGLGNMDLLSWFGHGL